MKAPKAALAVLLMLGVALAGCTGGDDALGIKYTPADDPVTEPFIFEATGSADRFEWDFADGTPIQEGKRVEHTFGFTDGTVRIKLMATIGDETITLNENVQLGSGQNSLPDTKMRASTDWAATGEEVTISGAASSDPDGDPLLYRWSCSRLGDLSPNTHGHEHGGGVPFGVQFRATVQPGLANAEEDFGQDMCSAMGSSSGPFSRVATVSGSIPEPGVYAVQMEVRDPKSNAAVGQLTLFVSPEVPPPQGNESFSGTLIGGQGDATQDPVDELEDGTTVSRAVHSFNVPIPNRLAVLRFSYSSDVPVDPEVTYEIRTSGGGTVVPETSESEMLLGRLKLLDTNTYVVTFRLKAGLNVDYQLDIDIDYELDPKHKYEPPVGA